MADGTLEQLEADVLGEIAGASDLAALDQVRVSALGKKGSISALMQKLSGMPAEDRKAFGQSVNALKTRATEALDERKADLEREALARRLATERADVTLPVRPGPLLEGRIHPLSQVFDEVYEIFADMGFSVAEGPDIDTDDNCFTKLNTPAHHPARQDMDTFYLKERADGVRMVLRPHTSPVQVRTMLSQKPPIRIIAPGRVYRCDSDQTHTPMFHQVEGLVIDEKTNLANLKWCLEEFCKAFFEVDEVKMRFRASHFPFTEPSMEVDIDAAAIGKPGQWLEILGSGMVHPNVLKACGL
ncbi:MAG: phenylalanine--tRNA ligase subunit alpha, partial [Hyphomicrobiaceae bacterium]|nr:phenylalanine--tRNA ligase subunit alpha [Hyphomicrobiaceae bacterium]